MAKRGRESNFPACQLNQSDIALVCPNCFAHNLCITKYKDIVRVIELCHKSGISDISFTTAKNPDEQDAAQNPVKR